MATHTAARAARQAHRPRRVRAARAASPAHRRAAVPTGRPARRRLRRGNTGVFERLRALPDNRVVDGLLRGRAWIWLIGHAARRHRRDAGVAAQAQRRHLARVTTAGTLERRTPTSRPTSPSLSSGERVRDAALARA